MHLRIRLAGALAAAAAVAIAVAALLGSGSGTQAVAAASDPYEVWYIDQNDTRSGPNRGGLLHIYGGPALERDGAKAVPETIDLGGAVSDFCADETGAAPVRPHMLAFNGGDVLGVEQGRFAIIAWVVSGHVSIHDARTRETLACLRTSPGAGGARQAHAAWPTPDEKYLVVANQNGKLVERIRTDWERREFTLEASATLSLYDGQTPSGADRQDATLRPDNAPICVRPTYDGRFSFVSLRGGGAFVVDHNATPMTIVAEYDRATIADNGCGQIEAQGKMFVNSGAGAPGDPDGHAVYAIDVASLSTTPGPPNTPAPTVVYDRAGTVDGHGFALVRQGRHVLAVDRERNDVSVIDAVGDKLADRFTLEGALSDDPAPDLLSPSPDRRWVFATLRGPAPLSGGHNAIGSTPGLGIIRLEDDGTSGRLVSIAPARRQVTGTPDPHGIGVRVNFTPAGTPPPAPPAVRRSRPAAPPRLTLGTPRTRTVRAATLRTRGLALRAAVMRPARLDAVVRIDARTARRLGIPQTIGTARRAVLRRGVYTLRVRPTRRAARALPRAAGGRLTARITATTIDGRRESRTLSLSIRR